LDLRREEIGGWRKLHDEDFYNLCSPLNIIRVMKSRRMRWVGHVAHMRDMRNAYRILL